MDPSLSLRDRSWPRFFNFLFGLGMMVASIMTIRHFFLANYPTTIFSGSFCDINSFFNCDSSAYSAISQIKGVPLGYFGFIVGGLVVLGSIFPSPAFERTNKSVSFINALGVLVLFLYSVFYLRSLCLLCSGYYVFSLLSLFLFWRYGIDREAAGFRMRFFRPSLKYVITFAAVLLLGAYAMVLFHRAKSDAQSGGVAARVVQEYYSLSKVKWPSEISPYWSVKSTDKFEDAPIQVVEYGDFLCSDCLFLYKQLTRLKQDFKGQINVAFQFFPLEKKCNTIVEKNLHPGSCDLTYLAAYDPSKFQQIHDEIFNNFKAAKDPAWRQELARKYHAEDAANDPRTRETVERLINTGAEYEKTSEKYLHGIRSTPTLIINNRMIIGTLAYPQLKAIFQSLVDEKQKPGEKRFLENWEPTK